MSQSNSDADEYHFIGSIVRNQTKYGSTINNSFQEPRYLEHKLQPSDTLQGLALKYNVSMERIKRANNLWTSDSLFSRSTLNIPIIPDQGVSPSSSRSSSSSYVCTNGSANSKAKSSTKSLNENGTTRNGTTPSEHYKSYRYDDGASEIRCEDVFLEDESVGDDEDQSNLSTITSPLSTAGSSSGSSSNRINLSKMKRKEVKLKENVYDASQNSFNGHNGNVDSSTDDSKEESVADFLIRIDCYIAKSKNQVNSIVRQQGGKLSNTYSDDDLFKTSLGYQTANFSSSSTSSSSSYLKRQNSARSNGVISYSGLRAAADEDSIELPQAKVLAQGRKVMSSLKRLEQQQDEIFEL